MNRENEIDEILSEIKQHREENTEKPAEPQEAPKAEEGAPEIPEPTEPEIIEAPEIPEVSEKTAADEDEAMGAINIMDISDEELPEPEEADEEPVRKKKKGGKGKKTAIIILSILLVLIVGAGIAAYVIANNMLNNIVDNNADPVATTEKPWSGMDKLEESFDPIYETEATELASLNDMIREWYHNGTPCSSSHVLNVLLIGEDTRGKKILDEGTRADSAIIASINIDTKQITLTSVLRDAWAYYETEKGNAETGDFNKINAAMAMGDINSYINCLENLYKIEIDNYAIVNFSSFEGIVDELGGVELKLTDAEINEINNHQSRYGNVTIEKTFEGTSGKVKLNGKQALAYCRIRKLDSDNMRADRQKTCLIEIFNQTKDASTIKLLKIINKLVPYVKTSFGKSEIVKIAKYAFTQGWLDYEFYMQNLPENNLKGGLYYGGQWIWRPDYPADAYRLQSIIYGKSSITLAHIRPDTANCPDTGYFSEGYIAMYNTIENTNYGEVTVIETTTKKEDS